MRKAVALAEADGFSALCSDAKHCSAWDGSKTVSCRVVRLGLVEPRFRESPQETDKILHSGHLIVSAAFWHQVGAKKHARDVTLQLLLSPIHDRSAHLVLELIESDVACDLRPRTRRSTSVCQEQPEQGLDGQVLEVVNLNSDKVVAETFVGALRRFEACIAVIAFYTAQMQFEVVELDARPDEVKKLIRLAADSDQPVQTTQDVIGGAFFLVILPVESREIDRYRRFSWIESSRHGSL